MNSLDYDNKYELHTLGMCNYWQTLIIFENQCYEYVSIAHVFRIKLYLLYLEMFCKLQEIWLATNTSPIQVPELGPKWFRLGPNETNPGSQNGLNLIWKKSPNLSHLWPIWPTLGPYLVNLSVFSLMSRNNFQRMPCEF